MNPTALPLLDWRVCPTGRPDEPLRMQRLEALAARAPGVAHAHRFWLLLHVARGAGVLHLPGQALALQPGQLVLLPPGPVLGWALAAGSRGEVVCFLADYYLASFPAPGLPAGPGPWALVLPPAERAEVPALLRGLARTLAEPNADPAQARAYLHLLLALAFPAAPAPQGGRAAAVARQFAQLLEAHFRTLHAVRDYAARLHLSPDHLCACCRQYLGHPARQLIGARVLAEARHLLGTTGLSVAEVGYALGFEDASHFGRFFRQHAGCSPRAYRQNPALYQKNLENGQLPGRPGG
jgi:AraC family transcriptional activator of pobA